MAVSYCLFNVKINTISACSLVESESTEDIYNFLSNVFRNQKKKCITTDFKKEYRLSINKIKIDHQFCLFHTKQKINEDINDYIKENNPSEATVLNCHDVRLFFSSKY